MMPCFMVLVAGALAVAPISAEKKDTFNVPNAAAVLSVSVLFEGPKVLHTTSLKVFQVIDMEASALKAPGMTVFP